jgi:gamma-glutamyl:cysteine ligase YbdK (ATP-grasp superfamily)
MIAFGNQHTRIFSKPHTDAGRIARNCMGKAPESSASPSLSVHVSTTESMLEVSTDVHTAFSPLREQLLAMRDKLVAGADRLDIEVLGGGAHSLSVAVDVIHLEEEPAGGTGKDLVAT